MSIPYLPGWWDEIAGSATQFVSQLPEHIQPDRVAAKRLQEMVQQNPAILEQFANMDPGQRALFEQTMGFRNQAPLQNLAPGFERQRREEFTKAIGTLTPDQMGERAAGLAGVRTQRAISREATKESQEDILFKQQSETGELQLKVLTSQAKEVERLDKQIEEGLAKFGTVDGMNIRALVKGFVRGGQSIDPLQALVIARHPGASSLFDAAYKIELQQMQNEAQLRLASMRDPNESQTYLRAVTELGNQLNDAEARLLAEKNAWANNPLNMRKEFPGEAQLTAIREQRARNSQLTQAITEKLVGGTLGITPPSETPEQRLERLRRLAAGTP